MTIIIKMDGKQHSYVDVANLRITYVSAAGRDRAKQWEKGDMIRIQAYRGDGDNSLHWGAEIPLESPEAFLELIQGILAVYAAGRSTSEKEDAA